MQVSYRPKLLCQRQTSAKAKQFAPACQRRIAPSAIAAPRVHRQASESIFASERSGAMAQDDEYPAGVSDARLAACQQDVLKMVELAAQVAEGLAANVDPEAEGAPEANTIKEDAAMFLRLADGVQETMAQSRWPVEHAYARSAENLLLRRRVCNVFLTTALRPLRSFPLQHQNKPRGIPRVVGARHSTCDEETY